MKTLHSTSKNIAEQSLFVRGGTIEQKYIKMLLNDFKYPMCTGIYKRKILESPEKLENFKCEKPVWYENRNGGVKFYTINENSIPESLQDRYNQILKIWETF